MDQEIERRDEEECELLLEKEGPKDDEFKKESPHISIFDL